MQRLRSSQAARLDRDRDMNHKETVRQGIEAEAAKPVLDRAFDRAKEALTTRLLGTSPAEPQAILTLHAAIQGIEAARTAVSQEIGAGVMSGKAIEAEVVAQQTQN